MHWAWFGACLNGFGGTSLLTSDFVFKIMEKNVFGILCSYKKCVGFSEDSIFRGDWTDVSAETKTLLLML